MTLQHITIRNTTFNVNPEVPSWPDFWDVAACGLWEPEIFELMDRFLTPEWRWVDIGAWIGPTVLYAAKKCGRVDAYECDPVALKALHRNLDLNPDISNVEVNEFALGYRNEVMHLWSSQLGNSESSFFRGSQQQNFTPVAVRDAFRVFEVKGYASDKKTIVKMDVEGSEFVILPRLKEVMSGSKCIWYISFHGPDNIHTSLAFRAV